MKKKRSVALVVLPLVTILTMSCTPDCREITVSIAYWQTSYEDNWIEIDSVIWASEMVDTTVAYTIEKYYSKMNYSANSSGKETGATCTHYVTIRNNNDTYSNWFAIRIEGKEYNESKGIWQNMSKSTSYVTIYPNSTHTFQITHSDWWHNRSSGYSEDDITLKILQSSNYVEKNSRKIVTVKRKQTRRIDRLIMKDTVVNNCECDVDALKARSEAVSEMFELLKKQKLIRTK